MHAMYQLDFVVGPGDKTKIMSPSLLCQALKMFINAHTGNADNLRRRFNQRKTTMSCIVDGTTMLHNNFNKSTRCFYGMVLLKVG